mgnify:CR=1 FL=1
MYVPHPNDPTLRSFIEVDATSDFPIQNLPYGVFSTKDGLAPRALVSRSAITCSIFGNWNRTGDSNVGDVSCSADAESLHGAGAEGLVAHAGADQRIVAP